jgi:hypothetical protein
LNAVTWSCVVIAVPRDMALTLAHIFVFMTLALFVSIRLYAYYDYKVNWKVCSLSLSVCLSITHVLTTPQIIVSGVICEAVIVGEAVFVYFMTGRNIIPLALGIFLPITVLSVVMCFGIWRLNDYGTEQASEK